MHMYIYSNIYSYRGNSVFFQPELRGSRSSCKGIHDLGEIFNFKFATTNHIEKFRLYKILIYVLYERNIVRLIHAYICISDIF